MCQILISDEMTIYTAAEYKKELTGYLSDSDEVEISLQEVTELDSAGLQIMLLLNSEAKLHGKELRFVNHSPAVIEVFELLNLASFFDDPTVLLAAEQAS